MRHFSRKQTQRRTRPALARGNTGTGRCTPKRLLHPTHHTPKRPWPSAPLHPRRARLSAHGHLGRSWPFAHLHPGRPRLFMRRAVRPNCPPHSSQACNFFDSVPDECPSNPQGITALVRQSLDQGSFHAGLIHIPRVRFHIGHVGDGEERHGKARVLTRVVILSGKREKRSDRPAQIRLFTTQVI